MLSQRFITLALLFFSAVYAAPSPATNINPKLRKAPGDTSKDNTNYIVVLKPDADRQLSLSKLPNILGQLPLGEFAQALFKDWSVINGYSARLSSLALQQLLDDPDVEYIQQDGIISLDSTLAETMNSRAAQDDDALVGAISPRAPPITKGKGKGVVIYSIDTGVQIQHEDFGGRASYGFDCLNQGSASDGNGHGTHTASTAAGRSYGPANEATVKAVRVLGSNGSGSLSQVICGVDWVTKDAQATGKPSVAIMSLGGSTYEPLDIAVRNSIARGVHYSIAAGNSNVDAATTSPARVASAITVGAIDSSNAKASFSNFGSVLDVWYLGVQVTAAWIDGCSTPILNLPFLQPACPNRNKNIKTISGTSMAAPGVAGLVAAALSVSSDPRASPALVAAALTQAAQSDVTGAPAGSTKGRAVEFSV